MGVNVPLNRAWWDETKLDGVHSEGGLEVSGRISSSAASPVPERVCVCDAESTGKRVTIVTHFWPRRPGKVGVLTETVVRKL